MSLRLCIAAAALLCSTGAVLAQDLGVDEQLQFADGMYARGLYDSARKEYERFLDANPKHARADVVYFRIGECARELGDSAGAVRAYGTVVTSYPESPYLHRAGFRRGEAFYTSKMYAPAADLFAQLLKTDPPAEIASAALYMQGEAFRKMEKPTEAAAAYEGLVKKHATSKFYTYGLLSLGELRKQEPEGLPKALALFQKVAADPPSDRVAAEALFQIAEIYRALEQDDESAKAYRHLMAKYPEDRRARQAGLSAAWSYLQAGLYADALSVVPDAKALAELPDDAASEWLYLKANTQRQVGKLEDAAATYAALVKDYGSSRYAVPAQYELALVHYRQGDYAAAIKQGRSFTWTDALEHDLLWLMAESHGALKQGEQAIQYYRQLIEKYPKSELLADSAYRLAHHLQQRERYPEAAQRYLVLVEKAPESPLAAQALFSAAYCYVQVKQHAQAVGQWARLVKDYGTHKLVEESLYQKAMTELFLKRDTAARGSFADLLKRFPKTTREGESRFWLGVLQREIKELELAESNLRRALELAEDGAPQRRATLHLGLTLYDREKQDEAATLLTALLGSPEAQKLPASMLEWLHGHWTQKGDQKKALPAAEQIASSSTNAAWQQLGWCLVGRSQLDLNESEAAVAAFEKALDAKANTKYAAEAALRLGDLAVEGGESAEAEKRFRQAIHMATGDGAIGIRSHAYAGLGRSALAKADHDAAARYFMSVSVLFDDDALVPECLYLASQSYGELGQPEVRQKVLEELQTRYPDSAWARRAQKDAEAGG